MVYRLGAVGMFQISLHVEALATIQKYILTTIWLQRHISRWSSGWFNPITILKNITDY